MQNYIEPENIKDIKLSELHCYTNLDFDNNISYRPTTNGFIITNGKSEKFKIMLTTYGYVKGSRTKQIINQKFYYPYQMSVGYYNKIYLTMDDVISLYSEEGNWEVPSIRFFRS